MPNQIGRFLWKIGRLEFRGFQPEMRCAALASFNKQFPFDQIEEVSVHRQRRRSKLERK